MSPEELKLAIDTVWVIVAGCMVFLMQAGFAMLEVGFSRGKNVGAVVAKILVNLSIGTIAFWAVGFALAFGNGNKVLGTDGFFLHSSTFSSLSFSDVPLSAKFLFEVVFCTVSLAIVWGTMLDRTKFGVYIIFAIVFAALIYPLVGHWIWGGGFLAQRGMQDFAGSTVVHLCGATAALAGTLMLGARIGKFDSKGKPHPIPGHSMPLAVLGVLILWFGWFGFNPGSTLGAVGARFADIAVTTNLAASAGVLGAIIAGFALQRTIDIGFAGNGAIAGLVAITAPCAYVEDWAACVIGLVAGVLMVLTVVAIDRIRVDDPIGAIAGHGMGGIWGTLSCGLFTTPALAKLNGVGGAGLFYGGGLHQLGVQALGIACRGRVRVRFQHGGVLCLQEDDRAARQRAAGARGPRHPRARHVGLSRAVPARLRRDPALRAGSQPPPTGAGAVARDGLPAGDHRGGGLTMQKIEAYIRHEALEAIRSELYAIGLPSMSVSDVLGSGRQAGIVEHYRGATEVLYLRPKLRLDLVVADEDVERAIDVILTHARSGEIGDGKVFVLPVLEAVRIRTGERGEGVVAAHDEAAAPA